MKRFLLCLSAVSVLAIAGCNENIHLGGKVAFDDGSPLTVGTVRFETDTFLARGNLRPDGTYTLGSLKEGDGVPTGTYRVYIANADIQVGEDKSGMPVMKSLIDEKYADPKTSGLTCEVNGKQRFDIQVERPK